MRTRHALSLAALALGCSSPPPRYPITDPAVALASVRARDARVRELRAHGSAEQYGAQGRLRGEVFVFVRRPSQMRVDTRAFGTTVSSVVSDGETLSLTDLQNGRFYTGPARPCVAAQLLGIPLEAAEVVAVLAGGPPLLDGRAQIAWRDGRYVLDLAGAERRSEQLELEITDAEREGARPEAQHPRPVRAELRDPSGVRAVLTFEDYADVDGVPFPRRVRVVMERDHVDLTVRYRELTLDPELPDDVFDTAAPPAVETVPVRCDAL